MVAGMEETNARSHRPRAKARMAAPPPQAEALVNLDALPTFHGDGTAGRDHDAILAKARAKRLRL